jgi:putative transposase
MTMPALPPAMLPLMAPFAPRLSRRVWQHAVVLVVGTILAPGSRPRVVDEREVVNAIPAVLRSGCRWQYLPEGFLNWKTVYWKPFEYTP